MKENKLLVLLSEHNYFAHSFIYKNKIKGLFQSSHINCRNKILICVGALRQTF